MSVIANFVARLGLVTDEEGFGDGERLLEALKSKLEWAVGKEAIDGIKEMVMGVVELGSKLNDTAQMTGQSVEGLQYYGFVAKLNSSNADEMSFAVGHLSRTLVEAGKGGGQAGAAFKKLGIDINSKEFKANSVDEKLQMIADKMAKLPDGTEKTALAMALFGRSGKSLIPTLNDLGKNGDELKQQFEELGGAISTDQASALDEFGDEVDKAKYGLTALKNQIVIALLPTLKDLLAGFMEWVKANRQIITSTVDGVVQAMGFAFRAIGVLMVGLAEGFEWLTAHRDLFVAVLVGLGAIIATFAIQAAIDWVLAFWPLILIGALVAGVSLAIKKLWEYVRGASGSWEEFGDAAMAEFVQIKDWFLNLPDRISDAFHSAWEDIKAGAHAAFEWIVNLPVIKQLIALYNWATSKQTAAEKQSIQTAASGIEYYTGGGSFGQAQRDYLASMKGDTQQSAPVHITGDTHITVTPGPNVNTPELAQMVKDHVDETHKTNMQTAFDALKGGFR